MGIQTTHNITRQAALERVKKVCECIRLRDYRELESISSENEEDNCLQNFIDSSGSCLINHLGISISHDKWTNRMLEDLLDKPFWRESQFDNYTVRDEI